MTTRQRQDEEHRQAVEAYYETGDESLLASVLAELRPRLESMLWAKGLRDSIARDDIVQETLMSMLVQLRAHSFHFLCTVSSWAVTICYRIHVGVLRLKAKGLTAPSSDEDPFLLLGASFAEPEIILSDRKEAEAQARTLIALATQAVLSLDANARACMVLTFYHGLPVPAAAAQLGIPESTFRTRLGRAIEELQAWGQTVTVPTSEVFDALRRVNTGDLFRETPQPATH